MKQKRILIFVLGQIISIVSVAVAMLWSAGRTDWWPAWAVVGVWLIWFASEDIIILYINPDLLAERLNIPKDAKSWDRALLSILRLGQLARYILAGLDQRHAWTNNFPLVAQVLALALCLVTTFLFFWAMASNPFFSQVARIQTDRAHIVAKHGPYSYVRHPAYLAMIMFEIALSLLLASWPAIIAGTLCAGLFVVRTALEDRVLQSELSGYVDYSRQVRFRLLPGIW